MRLYSVPSGGGLPERLPMERGILCSCSPDGTRLAYNRRGNEECSWSRYKGGQHPDIWLHDFEALHLAAGVEVRDTLGAGQKAGDRTYRDCPSAF